MRFFLRIVVALLLPASALAQEPVFPAPDKVKVDGVPPIPMAIADGVAPYGQFRQARFLAWHPTRQRILVSTAFGNVSQIHEVRGPGAARTQLTFFRDGVTAPLPQSTAAWYAPGGEYFLFAKDTGGGAETTQLFRYDSATRQSTLVTD